MPYLEDMAYLVNPVHHQGNNTEIVPTSKAIPKIISRPISTVFNKLPGFWGTWFAIKDYEAV